MARDLMLKGQSSASIAPAQPVERISTQSSTHHQRKWSFLRPSKPTLLNIVMYSIGIVAIGTGGVTIFQAITVNEAVAGQAEQLQQSQSAVTPTNPAPSTTNAKQQAVYAVAPDLPKFLTIQKLGLTNVQIAQVGLTKDGAIGAPLTATQVAWYNGSAKPGAASGALFIDGHIAADTHGGHSVFTNLSKLVVGDKITVTRGDDIAYTFQVTKTAVVPLAAVDMNAMLTSAVPGKLGLNLMTCAGTYQATSQTFDHRTEVFAVKVD